VLTWPLNRHRLFHSQYWKAVSPAETIVQLRPSTASNLYRLLALLDPPLGRATLVVEPHHGPARRLQIGHDELEILVPNLLLPPASQCLIKLNQRQALVELGLHQVEFR